MLRETNSFSFWYTITLVKSSLSSNINFIWTFVLEEEYYQAIANYFLKIIKNCRIIMLLQVCIPNIGSFFPCKQGFLVVAFFDPDLYSYVMISARSVTENLIYRITMKRVEETRNQVTYPDSDGSWVLPFFHERVGLGSPKFGHGRNMSVPLAVLVSPPTA